MRCLILALMVAGCASSSPLSEGAQFDSLAPMYLQQAFADRAVCVIDPQDGQCETVSRSDHISATDRVTRDLAADDIERLVNEPMGRGVRHLPMFARHHRLFARLEAQRALGDYRYLKHVTLTELVLEHGSDRWCERITPATRFENTAFYFSNSLTADLAGDERMEEQSERELRAFLREVIADSDFRSAMETGAREAGQIETYNRMFGMLDGTLSVCSSFAAVVRNGRLELTRLTNFIGGQEEPTMTREVRLIAEGDHVLLRAN